MQPSPSTPFLLLLLSLASFAPTRLPAEPLNVGDSVPAPLQATDQAGQPLDLAATLASGTTLVYFYPKADTPGCTAQACSLRDSFDALRTNQITVLGVSQDAPTAQSAFATKHNLPFTLLADTNGAVADAFGVPELRDGISKRQSFLVRDGTVVWRALDASTATHAADVLSAAGALPE